MFAFRLQPGQLTIIYAATLHSIWAVLLLLWGQDIAATPVHSIQALSAYPILVAVFLLQSSVWAIVGHLYLRDKPLLYICTLIPQQLLMMLSGASAIQAVVLGKYADGTIRSPAFILADQLPLILAALMHTAAMIIFVKSESEWKSRGQFL